jgi:hypothetical protein
VRSKKKNEFAQSLRSGQVAFRCLSLIYFFFFFFFSMILPCLHKVDLLDNSAYDVQDPNTGNNSQIEFYKTEV